MVRPYFRQVPNFEYVNRNADSQDISNYISVKNLFKRGKLREDIFGNLNFFTKYQIIGDERPDNVAYKIYNDETLDWVVLLSNNILNIQTEWPLSQQSFDSIMLEKYGSYETLYSGIHHYETLEVKNSNDVVLLSQGLQIPSTWQTNGNFIKSGSAYYYEYYDDGLGYYVTLPFSQITIPVTNYDYESKIENDKRNIFILKPNYLNVIFNDLDGFMPYKKGAAQYVSSTLKKGENIRLYS
jgi:hypothetical protein